MAAMNLIEASENGTLAFGDYSLPQKTKLSDFEFEGDLYKVKTFREITRLEKNGLFVYESVPGTDVREFTQNEDGISFIAAGGSDTMITVGLEGNTDYIVMINDMNAGRMTTGTSGKLSISVDLSSGGECRVSVNRLG